jgi:hypothetical protein
MGKFIELRREIQRASGSKAMHLLRIAAGRQLMQEEMLRAAAVRTIANESEPRPKMRLSFLSEDAKDYKGRHCYATGDGYSVVIERFACVSAPDRNQQYLERYEERRYTKEGRLASRKIITGYNLNSMRLEYTPPGAFVGKMIDRQSYPRRCN